MVPAYASLAASSPPLLDLPGSPSPANSLAPSSLCRVRRVSRARKDDCRGSSLLHPTVEVLLGEMAAFCRLRLGRLHALEILDHEFLAFPCRVLDHQLYLSVL